jgi:nitrite reductase/ring-hydroxylating ferredoxin subunit
VTIPGSPPEGWARIASLAELAARGRLRVEMDGLDILLVAASGAVYACGNVCAHQHMPMLHAGAFHGHSVSCPMHGWTYDVRTGACEGGEGKIPTYPVLVSGDDVFIAHR